MIAVLAGRRIDASGAKHVSFPLESMDKVSRNIGEAFDDHRVSFLISSAACGADLLGLSVARTKQIPFRIVLPSTEEVFREQSVTDRPGSWGALYDEVISVAKHSGNLVVLRNRPNYFETNEALFHQVDLLRDDLQTAPIAFVIWDGDKRPLDDITADFLARALEKQIDVLQIGIL